MGVMDGVDDIRLPAPRDHGEDQLLEGHEDRSVPENVGGNGDEIDIEKASNSVA